MPMIRFYPPKGITSVTLSDGTRLDCGRGMVADSKYIDELESAGFQAVLDVSPKEVVYPGTLITDWGSAGAVGIHTHFHRDVLAWNHRIEKDVMIAYSKLAFA